MRVNAEPLHTYAHAHIRNARTATAEVLMVGVVFGPEILLPKVGNYAASRLKPSLEG